MIKRLKKRHGMLLVAYFFVFISIFCSFSCAHLYVNDDIPSKQESKLDRLQWIEDDKEKLDDWLKDQDRLTKNYFSKIKDLSQRINRYEELFARFEGSSRFIHNQSGIYYLVRAKNSNTSQIFKLNGPTWKPLKVIDQSDWQESLQTRQISYFYPSNSGRYIVLGLTSGGSENSTLRVFDTDKNVFLSEETDQTQYASVSFLPDDSGFLYVRHDSFGNPDQSKKFEDSKLRLHLFGQDMKSDLIVAATGLNDFFQPYDQYFPTILKKQDIVVLATSRSSNSPVKIAYKELSDLNRSDVPWKPLVDIKAGVIRYSSYEDGICHLSPQETNMVTCFKFTESKPQKWTFEVPKNQQVVDLGAGRDAIYLIGKSNLRTSISVFSLNGVLTAFHLEPLDVNVQRWSFSIDTPGFVAEISSVNYPGSIHLFDPNARRFDPLQPDLKARVERNLTIDEHWVKSHDGVKIPLLIVKDRSSKMGADTPILLTSYAAYGALSMPRFERVGEEWYQRGGARGYCLARGGGELGPNWHESGRRERKLNSVLDNIACAEYIVSEKLSRPERMAFMGTSAGGIIAGNMITKRPDLFRSVVVDVGVVNISLNHKRANGPANFAEYGDPNIPGEAKVLKELDAVLGVKSREKYPAVLVTHGYNDSRVPIWMSAKFAYALQSAQSSKRSILMRTNFEAGHGLTVSSINQDALDWAEIYSFLFEELEM